MSLTIFDMERDISILQKLVSVKLFAMKFIQVLEYVIHKAILNTIRQRL